MLTISTPLKARHIIIENIQPCVDGGLYPAKAVVGRPCVVRADIFRDGFSVIRAVVKWRKKNDKQYQEAVMSHVNNDEWHAQFPIEENAPYVFTIEAWTDLYSSWLAEFRKHVEERGDPESHKWEGLALLKPLQESAKGKEKQLLNAAIASLQDSVPNGELLKIVSNAELNALVSRLQPRQDAAQYEPEFQLTADRPAAEYGTWYEFFVRSQGTDPAKSGTFQDAENRLPDIKAMGFNVIYLAPIHPVGVTGRKGRNNSLTPAPQDPGCPWAIGNSHGGHTAIDPALGTFDDFNRFLKKGLSMEMEVAMDFAVQCSPDHPWVAQHPDWFYKGPDGRIRCAENPPMKYEDIYFLNFDCEDYKALWHELKQVVLFWVNQGVKIFRVDNPHTKPVAFWEWLIRGVQSDHPEVIFLAEAFTRPKMMKRLSKVGFTQSYTYFTWRNTKQEIMEYMTELTQSGMERYFRPHFFINTPDVLSEILQKGGAPAFRMRLLLGATLSPNYGIYSGFELCENEAIPGTEEYLHSEKFEIKVRDWNKTGNIKAFISKVNAIRDRNPAFQQLVHLRFFDVDNSQILAFIKWNEDRTNIVIVVINMDPFQPQQGTVKVPLDQLGVAWNNSFEVRDLLTDQVYTWGENNFVRLEPSTTPGHIFKFEKK